MLIASSSSTAQPSLRAPVSREATPGAGSQRTLTRRRTLFASLLSSLAKYTPDAAITPSRVFPVHERSCSRLAAGWRFGSNPPVAVNSSLLAAGRCSCPPKPPSYAHWHRYATAPAAHAAGAPISAANPRVRDSLFGSPNVTLRELAGGPDQGIFARLKGPSR